MKAYSCRSGGKVSTTLRASLEGGVWLSGKLPGVGRLERIEKV